MKNVNLVVTYLLLFTLIKRERLFFGIGNSGNI